LAKYNYSSPGLYFVTICTHDKALLFGEVVNGQAVLNAAGRMAESWWRRSPAKFPGVLLQEFVIMPNHLHGLLELTKFPEAGRPGQATGPLRKVLPPMLGPVMQWYKTVTTRAYFRGVHAAGWPAVRDRLWQRNYYEHIVRNEEAARSTAAYILENPQRWNADVENPKAETRVPDSIFQIIAGDS
jgi:REP-associated tyrosine transposase